NCKFTHKKWDASFRPTFGVLTKEAFKDPAVCKIMVDQFPTPGEMSHHEYVQSADSSLKGYEEKVVGVAGLELQVSTLKKQEGKKKIKSLTKSLDDLHAKVARLSATLNQATLLEAGKDEEILRLKTTSPEFASIFSD
nr:hypothetical protein [Tanacetum cinerariifolium]